MGCILDIPTSVQPTRPSHDFSRTVAVSGGEYDRCRADDKVRCADGSVFICTDQQCDGKPDCPGGDDEENCPPEETGLSQRVYLNGGGLKLVCVPNAVYAFSLTQKLCGFGVVECSIVFNMRETNNTISVSV